MIRIHLLVYSLLFIFTASLYSQKETVESVTKQIEETYSNVFKGKLLLKKIDATEWNDLISEIGRWVKNKTNDIGLLKNYSQLSEISNDIVSGYKFLYNVTSSNAEQTIGGRNASKAVENMLASNKKNNGLADTLDNTVYFWGSKRQVQSVLLEVNKTLDRIVHETMTMYKVSFFVHKGTFAKNQ